MNNNFGVQKLVPQGNQAIKGVACPTFQDEFRIWDIVCPRSFHFRDFLGPFCRTTRVASRRLISSANWEFFNYRVFRIVISVVVRRFWCGMFIQLTETLCYSLSPPGSGGPGIFRSPGLAFRSRTYIASTPTPRPLYESSREVFNDRWNVPDVDGFESQ